MTREAALPPGLSDRRWDSENFGLPVREYLNPHADEAELAAALTWCRRHGGGLVYWMAAEGVEASVAALAEFKGTLVDRKTTYERSLEEDDPPLRRPWIVKEIPPGPASRELQALGLAAGEHSRFRVDPRFPRSGFELLYRTWTERSARREIADVVLGAVDTTSSLCGMLTIALRPDAAEIGLVAVADHARGLGVGGALMSEAHLWMRRHDAPKARVVTQGANRPACALYERWGYSIGSVLNVHHFWPGAQVPR